MSESERDTAIRHRGPSGGATLMPREPREALGERVTHESYGMACFIRQGGTTHEHLHGTDLKHLHSVVLRITEGVMSRDLSRHWYGSAGILAEVEMTEAQFVSLVSRMNMGDGTPVTILKRRMGDLAEMEPPPAPVSEQTLHRNEFKEDAAKAGAKLDAVIKAMEEALDVGKPLSMKTLQAMMHDAKWARQDLESSMPFVERSFEKAMDAKVDEAKATMEAHGALVVVNLGLDVLSTAKRIASGVPHEADQLEKPPND